MSDNPPESDGESVYVALILNNILETASRKTGYYLLFYDDH